MRNERFWIAVVSKEHIERGVAGGFVQVCHGKQAPLNRMRKGDWIIVYSPKISMESSTKLHTFTAIGQVLDDEIYQYEMSPNFIPFRKNVKYYPCNEMPIQPFISQLEFIQNKKSWGAPFRFGFLEIKERDFKLISTNLLGKVEFAKAELVDSGNSLFQQQLD